MRFLSDILAKAGLVVDGTTKLVTLAGSGTRMVVADAIGVLSTQAIPTGGGGSTTRYNQTFTATAAQTAFTVSSTLTTGYFDVYLNGVKLNASSYSNTTSVITLVDGAAAGDIIDVVNYATVTISTLLPDQTGNSGKYLTTDGTNLSWATIAGSGTVTSVSVVSANGISGSVATATTTPAITLTLGAITPTSVNSVVISGSATPTLAVTGTSSISGSNTGDNATNSLYSGLVTNATHTGDATGATALTVVGLRGVALPALGATAGFLRYTGTGTNTWVFDSSVYLTANQSIALSGDISGTGTTAITTAIGTNKVTNAMLAQVSTATFKGRTTAATGNVEDLTVTQATAMLNVFSSTLKGLAPSSGGGTTNFLRADGTWAAPATGGSAYSVISVSTTHNETATSGTKIIKADTTGAGFSINLPTAVGNTATLIIKKVAGTIALIIDGNTTETVDGSLSIELFEVNESVTLISDNTNWQIV